MVASVTEERNPIVYPVDSPAGTISREVVLVSTKDLDPKKEMYVYPAPKEDMESDGKPIYFVSNKAGAEGELF